MIFKNIQSLNNISSILTSTGSSTPQNLLLWSEVLSEPSVWVGSDWTIADNISGTLEEVTITTNGANAMRQNFTCVPGITYYWSFKVQLPLTGAVTDLKYSVFDFINFVDIVAPTSYFSLVSTTVTRVTFSFMAPPGCTQIAVYTTRDTPSTGIFWAGEAWVYEGVSKSYVTTTTSIVP